MAAIWGPRHLKDSLHRDIKAKATAANSSSLAHPAVPCKLGGDMDDSFVLNPSDFFRRVNAHVFRERIVDVKALSPRYDDNLTLHTDYSRFECWLAMDHCSGFAIDESDELINVFSIVSGTGERAIACAKRKRNRLHVNCFAGPLEKIYARHGFRRERREKNWNEGGADIIYMSYHAMIRQ